MNKTFYFLSTFLAALCFYFYQSDFQYAKLLEDSFVDKLPNISLGDFVNVSQSSLKKEFKQNQLKQKWYEMISKFFESKFSKDALEAYFKLRFDREDKIDAYMVKKLDQLQVESFELTRLDKSNIRKINQEYLLKLKKLIGDKTFQEYLNLKMKFNSENSDLLSIEF